MQTRMPELSIRAEVGMPERLTRFLIEGVVQAALMYMPQSRPGLVVEPVLDDELILIASWPDPVLDNLDGRYVYIEWGPEFTHAHAIGLPHLPKSGLTMALGALGAQYIVNRNAAGYMPPRAVQQYLDTGRLHLVPDAPRFAYPAWIVWRDDINPDIASIAKQSLSQVANDASVTQEETMVQLAMLSDENEVEQPDHTSAHKTNE